MTLMEPPILADDPQQQSRFWAPGPSDIDLVDRFRRQQYADSSYMSFTGLEAEPMTAVRPQTQRSALQQHAAHSCGWQDSALSLSCQSSRAQYDSHGGRFFWVGQHARPSDSTDSSTSSSLLARALASQNSLKKLSPHTATACAPQLLQQQLPSQSQCLSLTVEGSPSLRDTQQWSLVKGPHLGSQLEAQLGSQLGCKLGSPGHTVDADPPPTPLQYPGACPDPTSGFDLASLSTEVVDTWASDCPPHVDQLLDWAADPELPLSLPMAENRPSAFSITGSRGPEFSLQLRSSPSMESFDRQLSCSWDTDASHLEAQAYFPDLHHHQAEPYSDALACSLLPSLEAVNQAGDEAVNEAASQQLLPSSEGLMTAQSSGQGSEASGDALDQLMESACCSLPEQLVGQCSSAVSVFGIDFSLAGHDGGQAGGSSEDRRGPQKKRCGRPRVYDLDTPVATGAATGSSAHAHMKGRGAKPKYICSTPEEAIVNRRKRNRDTATQSYYKRKQRIVQLTDEMERLRQDNTALQSLLGLAQELSQFQKGWIARDLSASNAPASVLHEVQAGLCPSRQML